MTSWKDDKDLGAWDFDAQKNKWGYLNDPRWKVNSTEPENYDENPEDEPQVWEDDQNGLWSADGRREHFPCGHWHKSITRSICIEFVAELYMLQTNPDHGGNGLNISSELAQMHGGYLYCASGGDGQIARIDPVTMIKEVSTDLSAWSATYPIDHFEQIVFHSDGYIHAMAKVTGYTGNWIFKLNVPAVGSGLPFSVVAEPLYAGNVCYGTDANIYGFFESANMNAVWGPWHTPVTGAMWNLVAEQLPAGYIHNIDAGPAYPTYALQGVTCGADLINFQVLPNDEYIFNTGPESVFMDKSAFVNQFTPAGVTVRVFADNCIVGPNEAVKRPGNEYQLALIRPASAFSFTTVKLFNASSGVTNDVLITGLEDYSGNADDHGIYDRRTIWHTNDRIYHLHLTWPNFYGRIFCIDPNGVLLYQYAWEPATTHASFTILGDYVYVWQDGWVPGDPDVESAIIKLTLNLEFVCIEDCPAGWDGLRWNEHGRNIVNDGVDKIFNFGFRGNTTVGLITKYTV